MSLLSIRVPDDLEKKLDEEAQISQKKRSEVIREALEDYLVKTERERFMAEMVAEAKAAYSTEAIKREAIEIAEDFLPLENEALDIAEGRKPGEALPENVSEKWWK